MARVSLIVLQSPGQEWPSARVASYRAGLEENGYSVEVLAVFDSATNINQRPGEPWCRTIVADRSGLVPMAVQGVRAANGEWLVIVDLAMRFAFEAILAIVEALESGKAEFVVASRPSGRVGRLTRRFVGTSDPASGMLGVTRSAAQTLLGVSSLVGSRFVLDFLTRFRGPKLDLDVAIPPRTTRESNLFDDLRQWKRLVDARLGVFSRLAQFCLVGASGMVVDLTIYATLRSLFAKTALARFSAPMVGGSLALAVAAVVAIATALTWNFSINRRLTFNDARREGSILRQYCRYVLSNLLGIGVSLSIRLILPGQVAFFQSNHQAAAVVGILAATGISFTMARWFVFSPDGRSDRGQGSAVAIRPRAVATVNHPSGVNRTKTPRRRAVRKTTCPSSD